MWRIYRYTDEKSKWCKPCQINLVKNNFTNQIENQQTMARKRPSRSKTKGLYTTNPTQYILLTNFDKYEHTFDGIHIVVGENSLQTYDKPNCHGGAEQEQLYEIFYDLPIFK